MSNLMMPSRVLLYGRVMKGISIDVSVFDAGEGGAPGLGYNKFLRNQFAASEDPVCKCKDGECVCEDTESNDKAVLAMIYGFEYEAHYYDLMAPTIMLVHGEGMDQSRGRKIVAVTATAAAANGATALTVLAAAFAASDGVGAAEIAATTAAEVAVYGAAAIAARESETENGATAASVCTAAAAAADGTSAMDTAAVAAAKKAAGETGATPASVVAAAITAAEAATTATAVSVAAAAANASAAAPYIGRVDKPFPGFDDNVRIWPYDKADFSLRLDPCSGPIESILLEAEIDDAEMSDEMAGRKVSGRKVGGYLGRGRKVSGRKVGMSGRKVRGD